MGTSSGACTDLAELQRSVIGRDTQVPVIGGGKRRYINLDNAASTPILGPVRDTVDAFYHWYASVHRGTGFKSQISTRVYEEARARIARFVGADDDQRVVVFVRNATEAINVLAARLGLTHDDVVLTTVMEHHSHLIPWRAHARVEHVDVDDDGRIDVDDLEAKLARHAPRVRLVAISGASNVTGVVPPLREIARLAHRHGALLSVDAAQLAPHRKIDVGPAEADDAIDFLSFSGHKMYAPLGAGALVARRDALTQPAPHLQGGGSVAYVSLEEIVWNEPPDRDEAGSPNVVGVVAFAAAATVLEQVGFEAITAHERALTEHALSRLRTIPGVEVYGPCDVPASADKMGVITFNVAGYAHEQVAAILSSEWGVGVRNGRFCTQPYLERLLGLSSAEIANVRNRMLAGDRTGLPGMVRASFGLYNTLEDVDVFCDAVAAGARGEHGEYHRDLATGDFIPSDFTPQFTDYFAW